MDHRAGLEKAFASVLDDYGYIRILCGLHGSFIDHKLRSDTDSHFCIVFAGI